MSRVKRWLVLGLYVAQLVFGLPAGLAQASPRESILYQEGGSSFYRVNPDGGESMALLQSLPVTPMATTAAPGGGGLLTYSSITGLYSSSTSGLAAANLVPAGFNVASGAYYSPDGTKIAFAGKTGGATYYSVYVMNADGTGATMVVPASSRNLQVLGWGNGGILYKDWESSSLTFPLWVVNPTTLAKSRLTPANFTALSASYSPDGSKIAVVASERTTSVQPYALYVLAGGPITKITTTPSIVPNSVSWAPAGDRVALTGYAAGDAGHYKLFTVNLNLATATGSATAVASATGSNSLTGVYWGDLEDPLTPTQITTIDASGQYGESVTLSATLKTYAGVALSGMNVNIKVNGSVVATGPTDAAGVFTTTWPINVSPGTYAITAEFGGNATYNSATTTPLNDKTLTVAKAVTTLTLPTKTLVAGDSLTLSGNLSALATGLSGKSIALKVNGSALTTVTTDASGNYTYTYTPNLSAGTYTVQADYAGDANYTASTASFNLVVTKAPTTLTTSSATINYLQSVTLSASLSKTTGGAPIGSEPITFKVNGSVVATVNTLASGVASYTYTPTLPGGTYTIEAIYPGSGTYQNAVATGTLTVQKAATTLTAMDATVVYGDTVNLQATLMSGATPVVGALVQFQVGSTVLGTKPTDSTGKAVWPNYSATLPAGNYAITVTYAGDSSYEASNDTANLTITKRPVTVVVNAATTNWSYPVNLTATLTQAGGAPIFNQPLTFKIGTTVLGTKSTDASGIATLNWPANSFPPGNYTLTVEFAGDPGYQSGTGTAALTINKAPTTLTGQDVTLTYGVNGQIVATLKSGTTPISGKQISFSIDGGAPLTAMTDSTGKATLTYAPALAAGTYTINLTSGPDTNYLDATATATLTVQKATVTLTAADASVEFGKPVTLEATLTGPTGPINGASLAFSVNGTFINNSSTDATGKATLTYTPSLAAGTYVIQVTYAGDSYYLSGADTAQLTVTKALSTTSVANVTIAYAANGSLTATLKDASGNPISGRSLAFKVNGSAAGTGMTLASGVATVAYTPTMAAGTYTIAVDFLGDSFYEPSSGSGTLTVDKAATTLVSADKTVVYNQTIGLTATLTRTADGAKIKDATVTFKVNGTVVGTGMTDVNGLATYNWKANLAAGTYPITVEFAGDTYYLATTEGAHNVTVTKAATTIAAVDKTVVYGQTVALTATLSEAGGPINNRDVEFFVNGTSVGTAQTNASGVATVNWPASLAAGSYTIKVDFLGDTYYLASTENAHSVTVTKANTTISTANVTVAYNTNGTLTATLTAGATPISGEMIDFQVNGVSVGSDDTDASGVATLTWLANLSAGDYSLKVVFGGNPFYNSSTDTKTVTVTRPLTTLVTADKAINVGQPVTLTATLTETAGGASVSGKQVKFTVDGTFVGNGTTDAAGLATFTYTPSLPSGTYTITAEFITDAFYQGTTDDGALTITKAATTIVGADATVVYHQTVALTATLTRTADGAKVQNGTVTFKVNGTAVGTGLTDANGVATFNWPADLAAGTYALTVDFGGNTYYLPSTESTHTVTVSKAATTIAAVDKTVTYGQTVTLTATLSEAAGMINNRDVEFFVNGASVGTAKTNTSGVASLDWPATLAAGTYTIKVDFIGDGYYLASSDSTHSVTVNKANTTISTADVTVAYNANGTLTATLVSGATPINGATIDFRINGSSVGTDQTDASGVATVTWLANLSAGDYPLTVVFAGDSFYNGATDSTHKVTVTKPATTLVTADQAITYGQPVTLTATLTETVGGAAINGRQVNFSVNGASVGNGMTNASGVATFTYTPNLPGGTYTITAEFLTDAFYQGTTDDGTLTVNKAASTIVGADKTVVYNQTVTLTATVTRTADGAKVQNGTVAFKVNGTTVGTGLTDANGVATFDWKADLAAGTYPITVDFIGNGYYLPSLESAHNVTVTKAATTIAAVNKTVVYGQTVTLTATLSEAAGMTNNRDVEFFVNGASIGTAKTNASGVASIDWPATLAAGSYTIKVDFLGDSYYLASTDSTHSVTVDKANTTISTTNVTVAYNANGTLTATLVSGATPISGATIDFLVNGSSVGTDQTDASGVATVTWLANLSAGDYPLKVVFGGDSYYNGSNDTKQVTVTKPVTTLVTADKAITYGQPVTLTATLTETAGGSPINSRQVEFTVNGALVGTGMTDASGLATFTYTPNLPAGPYTITAAFATDAFYQGTTDDGTLTVNKAATTIVGADKTVVYNQTVALTATLTRTADGAKIENALVTFKVNGTVVGTDLTDANGVATFDWKATLADGTYPITVEFAGDGYYLPSTESAHNVIVTKAATTIVAANATVTYGQSVALTATLTEATGPINNRDVELFVNGTSIGTAKTNASGVVTINWPANLAAGTYTIKADFLGDTYYLASSDSAHSVTVTKANTTISTANVTVAYNANGTLTATLVSGATPISGATIDFLVNGSSVGTDQTDAAGVATVTWLANLSAGTYSLEVVFAGDSYYNGSNDASHTVTVTKPTTTLVTADKAITYGQPVTLTATLTETAGGAPINGKPVKFTVNGTFVGNGNTDATGVATFTYTPDLPAGTYTISAEFITDAFYQGTTDDGTLTVNKAATTIVGADKTVVYNQTVALTATLTRTADGAKIENALVTFKVNGTVIGTDLTDANGVATVDWKADLAAGTYPITVEFAGDGYYLASTETAHNVTVTKAATTIVAADATVTYGQSVALTATLTEVTGAINNRDVELFVNGTSIGTAKTNASGVVTINWPANLAAGTYTIKADFAGDSYYLASSDSAHSVTVTKANTTISTTDVTVAYNSTGTLTATLVSGATPLGNRDVEFFVNGSSVGTDQTDALGVATLNWLANLPAGTYSLKVVFAGDSFYNGSNDATHSVIVTKPATTLVTADKTITYGQPVTLTATLTETAGGAPISGKLITFKVNGTVVGTDDTDASGVATFTYTPNLPGGTYTITAEFVADSFYLGTTDDGTLTVNKAATTIVGADKMVVYNQTVALTATLTRTADGAKIENATVTFKVNGTVVGTDQTDVNGVATVNWLATLAAGTYPITVEFAGDGFYLASSENAHNVIVTKAATTIVAADATVTYGQSVALTATLTEANGAINNRDVEFFVNGTSIGTVQTNASGVATINWPANLAAGTYTIKANFAGDTYYLPSSDSAHSVTVTKANTTISTADVTVAYNSTGALTATLVSGATPLNNRDVEFFVNGSSVGTDQTDASGVATLNWLANLPAGTYSLKVVFAGDSFYNGSNDATHSVIVTKPATTLVTADKTITYGQPVTLTATLTETAGGAPISGKLITFKVNGTVVGTDDTDASGVATFTYTPNLPGGTYTITAEFVADSFYLGTTDDGTLTVNKAATTIVGADKTVVYNQTVALTATLTRTADGAKIENATVTFKVNGTVVGTDQTDANGVATVDWLANLAAGTYPITVEFAGDGFYLASSENAHNVIVTKAATTIVAADATVTYGQSVALTATLTEANGAINNRDVEFFVNGTSIGTVQTNASGVATIIWPANLAAGTYTIKANFAGDIYYLPSSDSTHSVTVNKANTTISTADVTVAYNATGALTATLVSGATPLGNRDVEFFVNGSSVGTDQTDASGVATLNWLANLPAGTYSLKVVFAGDSFYNGSNDTKQVTVTKPATSITVNDVTETAGNPVTLTATLTTGGNPLAGKSVEFKVNGTVVGTGTTLASGVATFTYTPSLGAGIYTIDATFLADPFYLGSTDSATMTLNAAPSTIVAVDATGAYNSPVTLTATLTSGGAPVDGRLITFKVNGTTVGTGTTNSSGVATTTWTINLPAGVYTIDAIWGGDTYFGPSTDSTHKLTVTKATTTLTAANVTITYNTNGSLTATLKEGANPINGATLTFSINGGAGVTALTNASGVATLPYTPTMAAGTYPISVTFGGDTFYAATSATAQLTVAKATTTLSPANVTIAYNQAGNLTAILKDPSGTVINGASIQFKVGATVVGSATMTAGVATLPYTPTLTPGNYTITADFAGDSYYQSSSGTATLTVPKANTTLSAANVSIIYSQSGNLTAILKDESGAVINGPSIQFKVGATVVGSAPMTAGVATLPYTANLAPGTYTITVDFTGDTNYNAAPSATATLTVTKSPTTLTANNVTIAYNESGNLTAILKDANGNVINGPSIQFKVGATVVGTAPMTAGVATLPYTPTLAPGTYTITVDFAGDSNYDPAPSATATLTVIKANTTLSASSVTIAYNQAGNLTAVLKDSAGNAINGPSIQFKVGATNVGSATMTAGVATLPYTANLAPGTYTITVDFGGDANYNAAPSATATLTVPKANTTLTANDVTIAYKQAGSLTAILKDAGGNPINGASIQFKVGATIVGSATMTAGVATLPYTPNLAPGTYTITVDFAGDANYNAAPSATATLTVIKANTTLTASDVTIAYNEAGNLTAILKDASGAVINGASIQFKVGATVVGSATMTAGVATLSYTPLLAPGTYTITVDFGGDANYNAAPSATATLTVPKANTTLTANDATIAYKTAGNLTAVLKDTNGAVINGASIQFKVNGTVVGSAPMIAGVATLSYTPNLAPGTYTITADFAGDSNYNSSTATANLTVIKANTTLTANDVTIAYNQAGNLTATLKDMSGAVINGPSIQFKVGATIVGTAPMIAGVATLSYTPTLAPGTYTITADFLGDTNYNAAPSATATLTVIKANTTLTANNVTIAYNEQGNLTAILKDASGNPINGASIRFTVGSTVVGSAPMVAGVATLPYTPILTPGTYTITVDFLGDTNYNAASPATATLLVTKSSTTLTANNVTIAYNEQGNLTAILKDSSGNPVNGPSIQFKVGATIVGSAPMIGGIATLPYTPTLAPGTYTITVDFGGDTNYSAAPSATATLTVIKANTTLTANDVTIAYKQSGSLTAVLKDSAGNPINGPTIQFKVNGTVVGSAAMTGGVATLPYSPTLAPGTYTITADFAGNANYNAPLTATATLTVTKANTTVTANSVTIAYNTNGSLTAVLKDQSGAVVNGPSIRFTVNGTVVGTAPMTGGVATLSYKPTLAPGSYTILAEFLGDTNYNSSSGSATLTVTKANTTLTSSNVTIAYNASGNLTAILRDASGTVINGASIRFTVAGTVVGNAMMTAGVATLPYTPTLTPGTYTITVDFLGDTNYNSSTGSATLTVTKAATTLTLTPASQSIIYGQDGTLTATLKDASGTPMQGQTITFSDGFTTICTGTTNSSGQVTCTPDEPAGPYTITATFATTTNYLASSASATLNVAKAGTTLTLTPNFVSIGQGSYPSFTAVLKENVNNQPVANVTISFSVQGQAGTFTGTTDATGTVTVTYGTLLNRGTYTINANFGGNGYYSASSTTGTLEVTATTTTLTMSDYTVQYNNSVTLQATLTKDSDGTKVNGQSVSFYVNGTLVGSNNTVSGTGTASVNWTANLPPGTYTVEAVYSGSGNYVGDTVTSTITVLPTPSTISNPTVSATTVQYSDPINLSATVSPAVSGRPVDFYIGGILVGTANTNASGVATLTGAKVPAPSGTQTVTATVRQGTSAPYYASASGSRTITVNKETVTFAYTGDQNAQGPSIDFVLEATLTDTDGSVLDYGAGNVEVQWTITGAGFTTQVHKATVNSSGVATKAIRIPKQAYSIKSEILVNGYIVEQTINATTVYVAGTGTGLTGKYYNGANFNTLRLTRVDPEVNFNWGTASPDPLVNADSFTVRWTGTIEIPVTGTYEFCVNANDGVRLWGAGTQYINRWTNTTNAVESCFTTPTLPAGSTYTIQIDFYDNTGNAEIQLRWRTTSSTAIPKQVVPSSQMYP